MADPRTPSPSDAPSLDVTVVLPVRNEGRAIEAILGDLLGQDFPRDRMEILVVDGASDDDTVARAAALAARDDRIRVLPNPARLASAARAIGAREAKGRFVAYVDGHCRIDSRRLLADMVELFDRTGADALARPQPLVPTGAGATARAIALARTSPFGHSTKSEIFRETEGVVPAASSGAMYRREVFARVGTFDVAFDAAEDVEFNTRVDRAGLVCRTSPRLAVRYEPRRTYAALWRQMNRYGIGRARLHRKDPSSRTLETWVPVAFVLGLPALVVAPFLAAPWRGLLFAPFALYAVLALVAAAFAVRSVAWSLLPRAAFAFPVIHAGLGVGYLRGLVTPFAPTVPIAEAAGGVRRAPVAVGDLFGPLHAHVVRPVLARVRGDRSLARLEVVDRFLSLDDADLRRDTLARVRALLRHARDTVPFYAARMHAAGFDPERLESLDELRGLPRLTRADLAGSASALLSSRFAERPLVQTTSGGTTSAAVPFLQTKDAVAWKESATKALRRRMGWTPEVRSAFLWGAPQDGPAATRNPLKRLRRVAISRLFERCLWLPAGDLSDAILDRHANRMERFAPHVLQAYPSAADLLARRLIARGRRLRIPLVLLTAEPVFPDQRARIAQAFGAVVRTFYGARECGWIAAEGTDETLRVNTAGIHLEHAEDGALLVTDLVNWAMPLIRYEVGDRGRVEPPAPDDPDRRPVLRALEGRLTDVFHLPSGRRVLGVNADLRSYQMEHGVLETQLVRNERDTIDVYWVPSPTWTPGAETYVADRIRRMFFGELEARLHRVERLAPSPNGKVRYTVDNVPRDGDS